MTILVDDTGFNIDDWTTGFVNITELDINNCNTVAIDLASNEEPTDLAGLLDKIDLIRVNFPSISDGRGYTIAAQLRRMGFAGRLRAYGHLIADQYTMARRSGFDEIQISDELAIRQPEPQWLARADWRAHDYQSRLRG